ncbi:MAG: YbjN domain-containing protein [Oscillospiraceae bacterium]|nr:YbjN domain-containing protein [Oscillospiraceae bacterium]
MNSNAQAYIETLKSNGMKVKDTIEFPNGETGVMAGWRMENTTLDVIAIFPEGGKYVWIRCLNFAKCPKDHMGQVMIACNALNMQYKWVKFYVDADGDVQAEDDAIVDSATVGTETMELVLRMAQIVDEAYPVIMKAVYGA